MDGTRGELMDAFDRLNAPRKRQLEGWERDPRQIQMALLEELTLLRKAMEGLKSLKLTVAETFEPVVKKMGPQA
jgi:hypothetical protein